MDETLDWDDGIDWELANSGGDAPTGGLGNFGGFLGGLTSLAKDAAGVYQAFKGQNGQSQNTQAAQQAQRAAVQKDRSKTLLIIGAFVGLVILVLVFVMGRKGA